jgi:CMP-N-acetylneuraminic acid synthetase
MISKHKILAIIPARGNSKGLPQKNIKPLLNKPLISWTIQAAQKSKYLDKIVVSTDSVKIAKISVNYKTEILKRPAKLATDKSLVIKTIFNVLEQLKDRKYNPNIVVLLQPTSPFRTTADIDAAIKLFIKYRCESVIGVCEVEHSPYWHLKIERRFLKPVFSLKYLKHRRQDLPKTFRPNGSIFIASPKTIHKYKSFYTPKTIAYIMSVEKSIDIDNEQDFVLAETLAKKHDNKHTH